jgi:hypothetical protein
VVATKHCTDFIAEFWLLTSSDIRHIRPLPGCGESTGNRCGARPDYS